MYTVRLLELLGRLRPLGARRRARDLVLDAALVLAAHDAEEPLLAPVGVPRVGDLPVFRTVLHAPPDDLDGVAAGRFTGRFLINTARVVLEVAVDLRLRSKSKPTESTRNPPRLRAGTTSRRWRVAIDFRAAPNRERRLDGPALHDHPLNLFFPGGRLRRAVELVLVSFKVGVATFGRVVTLRRTRRTLVGLAALVALVGVWIISLGAMMMAMSKSPVRTQAHVTEGTRVVVLAAAHGAAPADVRPGRRDLAAVAAIKITVEAHVLG